MFDPRYDVHGNSPHPQRPVNVFSIVGQMMGYRMKIERRGVAESLLFNFSINERCFLVLCCESSCHAEKTV